MNYACAEHAGIVPLGEGTLRGQMSRRARVIAVAIAWTLGITYFAFHRAHVLQAASHREVR